MPKKQMYAYRHTPVDQMLHLEMLNLENWTNVCF